MLPFEFQPIDASVCEHVRQTRTDPIFGYDYDVRVSVAGPDGYGPCRQCLQTFAEKERRLLFLHNPFGPRLGDYAAPVFIHEERCVAFVPGPALPEALLGLPLLLRSYDSDGHFIDETEVKEQNLNALMGEQFQNKAVVFVHVRNAEAKCFIAAATRVF